MELFENYKIRCLQVGKTNKWYFSVVDICAAVRGVDYDCGRNYWKWLKTKLATNTSSNNNTATATTSTNATNNVSSAAAAEPVSITNQLKLPAADGRLRYTDVMDADEVLCLLQQIPSPMAVKFRLWLLARVHSGKNVCKQLTSAIVDKGFAGEIKNAVVTALGAVVLLRTVRRCKMQLDL